MPSASESSSDGQPNDPGPNHENIHAHITQPYERTFDDLHVSGQAQVKPECYGLLGIEPVNSDREGVNAHEA
jgi:hypothetical protein